MPRFIQDIVALIAYLVFASIEIIFVFGMFLAGFGVGLLGESIFNTPDSEAFRSIALLLGMGWMAYWYYLMDSGLRKRIQLIFRKWTHKTIRFLGAGDAIYE